ncbi:MAG: hypothetical protein J7J36_03985 [Thermoplasmata archaeon]|nr:hypothetical protein [Thermoplasmata archaeon]
MKFGWRYNMRIIIEFVRKEIVLFIFLFMLAIVALLYPHEIINGRRVCKARIQIARIKF